VAHERTAPRTLADQLFGDMGGEDEKRDDDRPGDAFDSIVPAGTEQALSLANAGRAAFAAGQYELARGHFAAALKVDPRNRPVRALYHVASGFVMRARGQDAEAQLQFETALGHDPACHEAQRALGRTARRA
jgi:Tfp pilus assembly protein PilF